MEDEHEENTWDAKTVLQIGYPPQCFLIQFYLPVDKFGIAALMRSSQYGKSVPLSRKAHLDGHLVRHPCVRPARQDKLTFFDLANAKKGSDSSTDKKNLQHPTYHPYIQSLIQTVLGVK